MSTPENVECPCDNDYRCPKHEHRAIRRTAPENVECPA